MSDSAGATAIEELDKVLAVKPRPDGEAFTAATKAISALREEVIADLRRSDSPASRKRLGHLNAVLSVVLGGHFPLGQIPWDEIEKAKGWLKDIVASTSAAA